MGTPETAAFCLKELCRAADPVVGVVTRPARPAGRGQQKHETPVRRTAEEQGIPALAPEKLRNEEFLSALAAWQPDLIVVVAYGRILPRQILELPHQGCLNVHYSLLPKYRGAAPVAWAILGGEEKTGVTTMKLVEQMDAGPILLQEETDIRPDDTNASLQRRLTPIGARLLLETIRRLKEGSVGPAAQNEDGATYAPVIKKEDGLVDWSQSAAAIERRVRALSPWPSAYTRWNGKLLKVHRAAVVAAAGRGLPGEVVQADAGGLWVAAGEGILSLEEVQAENKNRLPASEFLKGARLKKGDRL
jgi:methionyl-tRNA formyltransferase